MMLFKSCPKCHGDLLVEQDLDGGTPDLACIQCGYIARPHERVALVHRLFGRQPVPAPAYATVPLRRRAS